MKKLTLMSLLLLATVTGCIANETQDGAQLQTMNDQNPTLIEQRVSKNDVYQGRATNESQRSARIARQGTDQRSSERNNLKISQGRDLKILDISTGRPTDFDPNFGRTSTQGQTSKIMNVTNRNAAIHDIAKARSILRQTGQFEPGEIVVDRDYMWVTVYKKERLTNHQQAHAEATAYTTLKRQLPNYKIEIRSNFE